MVFLKNRRRWLVRWHVTVQFGPAIGKVINGSKTFLHRVAARRFKALVEKNADYWAAGTMDTPISIADAVDRWYRHNRQFTDRTQGLYRNILPKFTSSLPVLISRIADINANHIRDYLYTIGGNGRSNRTCNIHLTCIKSFCRFLSETFEVANPAQKVKMLPEEPPDQRFLTDDEYPKILAVGDEQFNIWAKFIGNTGLRVTEFCELTWSAVDSELASISLKGKGRKVRTIPLNQVCRDILTMLKTANPNTLNPIILSKSNCKLSRHQVRDRCLQIAKKAGIPQFGPHSLRHYFATTLLKRGVSLKNVSLLLGHSSVQITETVYIHILPKDLVGTTDCLCR
jgi:site-specific recombinase XerD